MQTITGNAEKLRTTEKPYVDMADHKPEGRPPVCGVLEVLGAKWSILVLAELAKGAKRFKQLQRDVAVVKTQSLTDALRHLEANGLVERKVFPTVPISVEYSLTAKGFDFRHVISEMEKWALKWNGQ